MEMNMKRKVLYEATSPVAQQSPPTPTISGDSQTGLEVTAMEQPQKVIVMSEGTEKRNRLESETVSEIADSGRNDTGGPEAQEASHSGGSVASSDFSVGDDPNPDIVFMDDLDTLHGLIIDKLGELVEGSGRALPLQWSLPEFAREVIGEEEMQDPSYLRDVFTDLVQHGSQAWHWEAAEQLLSLI